METTNIVVRGAREHNLRNVSLELPRNKLIVFTGVSGSGKSSLAFDTLYAEGQRRYVESLSAYARQFLGQLPKPDVDFVGGLSPAVSIQQKSASRNPRSTVGTITEISDYLRVLWARMGEGYCPNCQTKITAQSREQIIGQALALAEGTRFFILAPVVRQQKGEFKDFFAEMVRRGYVRARVDGEIVRMTDDLRLDKRIKHDIEIVIDRLKNEPGVRPRLAEAIEQAILIGAGSVILSVLEEESEVARKASKSSESRPTTTDNYLSADYACPKCQVGFPQPSPQLFSFNSPTGMCPNCDGLGTSYTFDIKLLIPDPSLSVYQGAIPLVGPLKGMGRWRKHIYTGVAKVLGIDLKQPWDQLPEQHQQWLLYGAGDKHIVWEWKQRNGGVWKHGGKWEGIVPQLMSQFKKSASGPRRMQLEKYMRVVRCTSCNGQRLNPQARAVRIHGKTLVEVGSLPIGELSVWFDQVEAGLTAVQAVIASDLLREIRARLNFLLNVGLHYLTLDRSAPTLSGGEAQRIRLAGQIGSGLVGVLYVLDEPSIGLHPRDNERLLRSLEHLRDIGNTVLVVEHDEETMNAADFLVDFGPGPGSRGGELIAAGTPKQVLSNPNSLTGQYLTGKKTIPIPKKRRPITDKALLIIGARHNNLKNIDVAIPLGVFVGITGVSGSGKSSLINDILMEALVSQPANGGPNGDDDNSDQPITHTVGEHDRIEGIESIDKLIDIDQSPIGRTPRSNPATYTKVWDEIRTLFAQMTEAKLKGYTPSRFSFNRPGGRCEACEGNGAKKLEMDFLADIWITCSVCEGRRFNRETLQVKYRGKSIHDILEMEVAEALEHFEHIPKVHNILQTLHDVGLDYIKLGQPSTTLSGGEAQRIKLAKELCRKPSGHTLYILDEPTTGLHFEDIRKLLEVLHGFVERGNTVVVIEHNLDVIKTADWLIDLGPEGGAGGGQVIAEGTPEQVASDKASYTGQALKPILFPAKSNGKAKQKVKASAKKSNNYITHLEIKGAREHNLKDVSLRLPREQMTVFSGPSGSGKTSLAMDTIYAEGQRRYVESLSSYARQFLGQVAKPKVEAVSGLSPAIAIEQKTATRNPRSTVGTITEIYDYLRILYSRIGKRYCPKCNVPIGTQTTDEIIEKIVSLAEGTKIYILAPVERKGQERYESLFEEIRRSGYVRMRIDGRSYPIDEPPAIDHKRKHQLEIVVDRNVVRPGNRARIADAVEQALSIGKGEMAIAMVDSKLEEHKWKTERYSQHLACNQCGTSYEPLNPHNYSFNTPLGWCPRCDGLGNSKRYESKAVSSKSSSDAVDWQDIVDNPAFEPFANAIRRIMSNNKKSDSDNYNAIAEIMTDGLGDQELLIDDRPLSKSQADSKNAHTFQLKGLNSSYAEAVKVSDKYKSQFKHQSNDNTCKLCYGSRLRADAAATKFLGMRMNDLLSLTLADLYETLTDWKPTQGEQEIVGEVFREVNNRLKFLIDVGLDYVSLSRTGPTLSGGESQRIRLASQIGSSLTGVLYVLDEPTIGLHPRDNARLLSALYKLRDLGNTLLLVEHDKEIISASDYLVDFGPGAGSHGGEVVASDKPKRITTSKKSLTGQYLAGTKSIPIPSNRRITEVRTNHRIEFNQHLSPEDLAKHYLFPHKFISLYGINHNNIHNLDVHFPLKSMTVVTGVSGSGKSSLINDILHSALSSSLSNPSSKYQKFSGVKLYDSVIRVDQNPIGNSPSSNPATYTKVFDLIRELFSRLPESKVRGYHPRRFSFNQKGGRCEACEGNGQKRIEMHFLPDVWVTCDVCNGKRYNPETLAVQYHGKTISDVLNLSVDDALGLFHNIPKIRRILQTLSDVGLGYMALGQPAPTMSGGEAQRVKLAAELSRPNSGRTIYLLDEPTTGLHFDDVQKLLNVLHRLTDLGNTVIIVEHNLDVIKTADWIIDMGPEAGNGGGRIVVCGTPEDVVHAAKHGSLSHTGRYLEPVLSEGRYEFRDEYDSTLRFQHKEGDLEISEVGRDAKLPWEEDGEKWHTQTRVTSAGKSCLWDGKALKYVVDSIQSRGDFLPTNWNHRSIVEIASANQSAGWFMHASTGHEAYFTLNLRVKRNQFQVTQLREQLDLKPLQDTPGMEHYSIEDRVRIVNSPQSAARISIAIMNLQEIDNDRFAKFLDKAIDSYYQLSESHNKPIEANMPWAIDGQKWHTSIKGFPAGRTVSWPSYIVDTVVSSLLNVQPQLSVNWNNQTFVELSDSSDSKPKFILYTKDPERLYIEVKFSSRQSLAKCLSKLDGKDIEYDKTESNSITITLYRGLIDGSANQKAMLEAIKFLASI